MKKIVIIGALLLASCLALQAQKIQGPPSSTFGLDKKQDEQALRQIRARMSRIRQNRPVVALVLSGGGAKGAAAVGALKYLEEFDFPVDMVVGTSVGGLIGGLYALGYDAAYLEDMVRNLDWDKALSDNVDQKYVPYAKLRNQEKYLLSIPFYYASPEKDENRELHLGAAEDKKISGDVLGSLPAGMVYGQNVGQVFSSRTVGYGGNTNFLRFPIPFACVATDLVSLKAKVWHSGSINTALRSTMSIPGLFVPVRTDGMVLIDGGMRNNYPANIAKEMGADIVIGVDLSNEALVEEDLRNLGDILMGSIDLFSNDAFELNQGLVDIGIHPDLTGYNMLSFNREAVDSMLVRGYKAAQAMEPQLTALRKRLGSAKRRLQAPAAIDIGKQAVLIDGIDIEGVPESEAGYIRSKMRVKPHTHLTKAVLEEDIASIFGKGSYDYVNYEVLGSHEPFRLRLICKQGPMHHFGLGARIDSEDLVSLLLNLGFNTRALSGHSLDFTARISTHPYADLLYAYNGRRYATFNARVNVNYMARGAFRTPDNSHIAVSFLQTNQEFFLSNMHWSSFDVKLGLRNQFFRVFEIMSTVGLDLSILDRSVDYPGVFLDGRVERLDNFYFPTKGISAGLRGDLLYSGLVAQDIAGGDKWLGVVSADATLPFSLDRFSIIAQGNARVVLSQGNAPVLLRNAVGGDFRGRYVEQQIPYMGLNGVTLMGDNLFVARLEARYRAWKNHYFSLIGNASMDFNDFADINNANLHAGAGLGYAYNTILGPLKLQLHWSTISRSVGGYVSMGFNF